MERAPPISLCEKSAVSTSPGGTPSRIRAFKAHGCHPRRNLSPDTDTLFNNDRALLRCDFFGALIGFEREARDKSAGLRTHILISLAASVFAIISIESVHMPGLSDEQVRIDPLRVVEAVTAGVAFLAAGTIVLSRGEVRGLTTGAGMWLAGAIGLSMGFGHWVIAAFAVAAGLVVLFVIGRLEVALKWKSHELQEAAADSPENKIAAKK